MLKNQAYWSVITMFCSTGCAAIPGRWRTWTTSARSSPRTLMFARARFDIVGAMASASSTTIASTETINCGTMAIRSEDGGNPLGIYGSPTIGTADERGWTQIDWDILSSCGDLL